MPYKKTYKSNILLCSSLAILTSYFKFSYCIEQNFSGLSVTSHGCYSDLPIFWNTHLLEIHLWPYQFTSIAEVQQVINPIEYPFLTGFIAWLISFISPTPDDYGVGFFIVNSFFLSIIFVITNFLINRMRPNRYLFFAFAPAVFLSLFINWDMYPVFFTLLAVYFFDKNKFTRSSIFLAVAISFKFYPIVILFAIVIIGISRRNNLQAIKLILQTFIFFIIINLIPALIDFKGWSFFYEVSSTRGVGSGSIWEFLKLTNFEVPNLNFWAILATALTYLLLSINFLKFHDNLDLASMSFLFVFAFVLFNKVYSPQYVLWLTSLAVLVLQSKSQIKLFILWQFSEIVFHFGVWRYLYWQGFGQKIEGTSEQTFKWLILFRVLSLLVFALSIILPIHKVRKNKSTN
jgi:uncharacterized membrane protein